MTRTFYENNNIMGMTEIHNTRLYKVFLNVVKNVSTSQKVFINIYGKYGKIKIFFITFYFSILFSMKINSYDFTKYKLFTSRLLPTINVTNLRFDKVISSKNDIFLSDCN